MATPDTGLGSGFEPHREALRGLAYRMLGDVAAADDAVQETYLRWHHAERQDVAEPRAWLLTACARLCIDELRSARVRRETYVGPWLPEPLVEPDVPVDPVERAESISIAFLLLLERLQPVERAAYVLREVFDLGYDEIGRALGKTVAACRQIVSRAARRIAAAEHPARPDAKLTAAFAEALAKGDMAGLVRLLAGEAVLMSDGGGKVVSARRAIHGAERVARLLLGSRRKAGPELHIVPATVNGTAGLVLARNSIVHSVLGFGAMDGRIAAVYVVRNPDKLDRADAVIRAIAGGHRKSGTQS
jgi:RNA polymerase sigma-70 factor (ECF subfamily)